MNFLDINYLQYGNSNQKKIFFLLKSYKIFETLEEFSPILTGTFPIDIAIENSDLDIILESKNLTKLSQILEKEFGNLPQFNIEINKNHDDNFLLCDFRLGEFPVEIFAKNQPTTEQNAYQHMLKEFYILQQKGSEFRQKILTLKKQGIKTEPAFAMLLELEGDPYQAMLNYKV